MSREQGHLLGKDYETFSEIDRGDVKGCYTNCIGNGITRMGIRNLSWEDLASAGIKQSEVSKVEYSKAEMS